VIDFAIHLPRRHKYRDKTGKWLLKRVRKAHSATEVYAPKIGFDISSGSPQRQDLMTALVRDAMKMAGSLIGDLVDMASRDEPL